MTQNHDDDAAAPRGQSIFTNPWAQAGLTAVLTLVPARNYPRWLRRGIVWAPAVGFAAGSAYLVANPSRIRKSDRQAAGTEGRPSRSEGRETAESGLEAPEQALRRNPLLGAIPGTLAGLLLSGLTAGAFWADEKIERSLRRMRIPFPRAVMGVAAGAATWWSVTQDNARRQVEKNTQR